MHLLVLVNVILAPLSRDFSIFAALFPALDQFFHHPLSLMLIYMSTFGNTAEASSLDVGETAISRPRTRTELWLFLRVVPECA